jgi:hypothetical protein
VALGARKSRRLEGSLRNRSESLEDHGRPGTRRDKSCASGGPASSANSFVLPEKPQPGDLYEGREAGEGM